MKFSANLGFLWNDRPLAEAIRAAHAAGFDAMECHWPYETPYGEVRNALLETGMPMLGLNTRRGNVTSGDNGLAALPGRQEEARAAIDEALAYALAIGAGMIHVMAGFAQGPAAHDVFLENLEYACQTTEKHGVTILIEPLNRHDAPGYFLQTTDQAAAILDRVGAPNLRLMFDCYHVQRTEGDVTTRLADLISHIGHIQFAGAPDRGRPDRGELDYAYLFQVIRELGWEQPLGAEYKPDGPTDETLGWMSSFKNRMTRS